MAAWQPISTREWIPLTDGQRLDYAPKWSPNGNHVYYLSDRDGHLCVRVQQLDPATKQPVGAPRDFQHFHEPRLSMDILQNGRFSLSTSVDKIVFPLAERTGTIWMAEPRRLQ